MRKLRTRKDIAIVRQGKGSKNIYYWKTLETINKTEKSKRWKENPTLHGFLRKFKDKNLSNENMYKKICSCGFKLTAIYSLPKAHKMLLDTDEFFLWPIISFIASYNYNLAKFLTKLLGPVIPKEHCDKDPISFCEEIQQVRFQIAVELIFTNNPNPNLFKN